MIMNTILLVIGFILFAIGIFTLYSKLNSRFDYFIIMSIFTISISCILIHTADECKNIGALEVYRNNTELKIKYEIINNDTINCDSIVVFK